MKRKQPFSFKEFKNIYSKVPRLCVDIIIKTNAGILLTLRQKNGWIGQWHLPGGTVYYQEPILKAIDRIVQEELGIKVSVKKFLTYIESENEIKERGFGYSVSLVFLCSPKSSKLKLDDQVNRADYFKILPDNMLKEQKKLLTTIAF